MNWHPLVVHLPVALLLTGFLFDVVAARRGLRGLGEAGFFNLLAGVVGTGLAIVTGNAVKEAAERVPGAEPLVELNETLAYATGAVFAALLLWRWWARSRANPPGAAYLIAAAVGVVILSATDSSAAGWCTSWAWGCGSCAERRPAWRQRGGDRAARDGKTEQGLCSPVVMMGSGLAGQA